MELIKLIFALGSIVAFSVAASKTIDFYPNPNMKMYVATHFGY